MASPPGLPRVNAALTNPATAERLRRNIAGPGQWFDHPAGSVPLVAPGNWRWGNHPETGAPGRFLLSGRVVLSVDAPGNDSVGSVDRFVDLCAQLRA